MKYLWDTNIVIYALQKGFSATAEEKITSLLKDNQPVVSAITEIELLCWKTATETDLLSIKGFISTSIIIELEREVKLKTVEIRKATKIKLPDAIIAASALAYDLTLLTRNIKDFQYVENLKLLNPWADQ
jgi:predicted nucleic acid-binding protein